MVLFLLDLHWHVEKLTHHPKKLIKAMRLKQHPISPKMLPKEILISLEGFLEQEFGCGSLVNLFTKSEAEIVYSWS